VIDFRSSFEETGRVSITRRPPSVLNATTASLGLTSPLAISGRIATAAQSPVPKSNRKVAVKPQPSMALTVKDPKHLQAKARRLDTTMLPRPRRGRGAPAPAVWTPAEIENNASAAPGKIQWQERHYPKAGQ